MADFVAVIRRAVDGLANNTPEMRVKVYDKARSAVVRQLESMKPRPPEALFQRQIAKLEEAIAEVEAEHAEALPAEDAAAPAVVTEPEPVPAPVEAAAAEAPVSEEPAQEEEPAPPQEEPAATEQPQEWAEPAPAEPQHDEPQPEEAAAEPAYEQPADVYEPAETYEPAEAHEPAEAAEEPAAQEPVAEEPAFPAEPEPVQAHYEEPAPYSDTAGTIEQVEAGYVDDQPEYAAAEPVPEDYAEAAPAVEPEPVFEEPQAVEPVEPEPVFEPEGPSVEPPQAVEPELPHWPEEPAPAASEARKDDVWDWPSHADIELPAATPAPAQDSSRAPDSIIDDFDAYLEGRAGTPAEPPVAANAAKPDPNDAWSDFEALIGYDAGKPAAAPAEEKPAAEKPAIAVTEGEERLAGETAYPYRAVPKPRPSIARIGLAGLAVLLLAGGGYALWLNRDALTDLFNGPATPSGTPVVATGNGTPTPNNGTAQPADPALKIDEGAAGTKFTQRLTTDGKEIDEGPSGGPAGTAGGEGQSVAQQNVAPPPQTPAQPSAQQPGADIANPPAIAGEKMYLYEEMLGQSTPTAIEGGVAWEAREEQDDTGRPQTVVQGTITVPGRNLTALVTFKRNSDPSLPASHLVEIVFSVPAGFEGGAIESVQRISMKRTEQDRGNALIAVPARITDDFHMIALNDFPDARATNLELLRTRDWIDIPVTYRNGRRALLTMEKGTTGTEAFNKAIAQWQQAEGAQR